MTAVCESGQDSPVALLSSARDDVTAARDLPVSSNSSANTRLKYTRELPERDRV